MPLIQNIPEKKVLSTALQLVKRAKKSLFLTMIMKEEIQILSDPYMKLLRQKAQDGIGIKRIGFGTRKDYIIAMQQLKQYSLDQYIQFKHIFSLSKAQRMLIVDEKEMIFAVYTNKTDKLVFYTRYKTLVGVFVNYFTNLLH